MMIKKLLLLILFILSFPFLYAQSVNFVDARWEDLKTKADSENKYLFIDCYTEWCGFCKLLDKNTFHNPDVANLLNEYFVSAKLDMEKDYGINIGMKYRVRGFPTGLIFNPDGHLVYRILGYSEPEKYIESIRKALDPANQMEMEGVSDEVNLDFPQFYRDAFAGQGRRKWPDEKTVVSFLDQQKDLFDEISWDIIAIFETGDRYKQHFLNNADKYRYLYGPEVDEKVYNIMYNKLNAAIKEKNEDKFMSCLEEVEKYIKTDREDILISFKLSYYSGVEDWDNFTREFEHYLIKTNFSNVLIINQYCWDIYEKCNDAGIISKACTWMRDAVAKDAQYAFVDTYAALLYKNKNYPEAQRAAKLAIKTGKDSGENVKMTEELLEKINLELALR